MRSRCYASVSRWGCDPKARWVMRRPSGLVLAFVAGLALAVSPARAEESSSAPPGYPPSYTPEESASAVGPSALETAPHRPLRFRADLGFGYFKPADVNRYLDSKASKSSYYSSPDMNLLLVGEVSVAYYPVRFMGIRPTAAYFLSNTAVYETTGGSNTYALSSVATGLSLDVAYDDGNLVRLIASPGISRQLAWLDGYAASGLGLSIAVGAEFSFGQARAKGAYAAMVVRSAKLGITRRPESVSTVTMSDLDLTSVLFCGGFQMGI